MSKSKGNPNWIKGGPSPNPNGRKARKDGRDVAVGTAEALALLQGLRQDGWENLVTGLGQPGYDKTIYGTFALDVVDDATAFALWKGDDIGRKIVEVWPDEMLRRPFEIRVGNMKAGEPDPTSDEPDTVEDTVLNPSKFRKDVLGRLRRDAAERRNKEVQEQVKAELKRLDVVAKLKEALQFRRAYGGSGILMGVEDEVGDISKPLGKVIRKLNFLTVFERRELTPVSYYNDPQKENYRKVSVYQLNAISPGPGLLGEAAPALDIKIHESRLLLFGARPVSQGLTASLTPGWDFSEFTSVWRVLRSYQSAWGNTDNLLETFALAIWKLKDLALLVSSNNGQGAADLKARMQLMAMAQSVLRATVIDTDEDYQRQTVSLTGIPEILSLQMTRVASAVEMPVTRLFGSPPRGLDATGETDLQFFDNRVEGKQKDELQPEIEKLVRVVLQTINYAEDDWSVCFPELRQMSELDSATARKTQADTDAVYIDRGVLMPEEVTLHRFGGDEYSFETPLDLDARALDQRAQEREMKAAEEMQAQVDMAKATAEAKAGAGGKPTAPFPRADRKRKRKDYDPDQPRDENGRWGEGGAALPAVPAGKVRLFRAAKSADAARGAHFSPQRETAESYQDNPGFGGSKLHAFDIDPDHVLDLSKMGSGRRAFQELASELEYEDPQEQAEIWRSAGLTHVFHVMENDSDARKKAEKLYDWVSYEDDFPAGATTWRYLGDKKFSGHRIVQDRKDYDPDQPRDEQGRWGEGGSASPGMAIKERISGAIKAGRHPSETLSKENQKRHEEKLQFVNKLGGVSDKEFAARSMASLHALHAEEDALKDPRMSELSPARQEQLKSEIQETAEFQENRTQWEGKDFDHAEFQSAVAESFHRHVGVEAALKAGHVQAPSRVQLERARGIAGRVAQHLQIDTVVKSADEAKAALKAIPLSEDEDDDTYTEALDDQDRYDIEGVHLQLEAMSRGEEIPEGSSLAQERAEDAEAADESADEEDPDPGVREAKIAEARAQITRALEAHQVTLERVNVAGKSLDTAVDDAEKESGADDDDAPNDDPLVSRVIVQAYENLPRNEDDDPIEQDSEAERNHNRAQKAAEMLRSERGEEVRKTTFNTKDEDKGWKEMTKALKNNIRAYTKILKALK